MVVSRIQIFLFIQSLCIKVKAPHMELTANAVHFRSMYKANRGLPRNYTAIQVLRDIRVFLNSSNMFDEFLRATKNYPDVILRLNEPLK